MAEHPMLPLWTDAYLGDTGHLTCLEHGAYLLLLITAWRTKEKALPNDDAKLAKYARLKIPTWLRIKPTLMEFFEVGEDGMLRQGRLSDEAYDVQKRSERKSRAAKARWLKSKNSGDATASQMHMPPSPSPLPIESRTDSESRIPKREHDTHTPPGSVMAKRVNGSDHKQTSPPMDAEFDLWWLGWTIAGTKRDKGHAAKAYRAARKHVGADVLADGLARDIRRWQRDGTAPRFIPYPTSWLNGKRWADEVAAAPKLQNMGFRELGL
jgi:uncharacterized protein YdaU (DUF1376 family)